MKNCLQRLTCFLIIGIVSGCSSPPADKTEEQKQADQAFASSEVITSPDEANKEPKAESAEEAATTVVDSQPDNTLPPTDAESTGQQQVFESNTQGETSGEPQHCPCPDPLLTLEEEQKSQPNWFLQKRHQISKTVHALGTGLDEVFDGDDTDKGEEPNSTYLKLKLEDTQEEGGLNYVDHSIKLRLDLPNTEERLKLVFDSDPDDSETLNQKNITQESTSSKLSDKRDSTVGALRIIFNEVDHWRFSWDNGVRLNFPIELFSRFKAKRRVQITELWSARFEQKLFWFKEDGYGETSELWFERPITDNYFLSLKSEMQWLEDVRYFEYGQSMTTIHNLNDTEVMIYSVGVLGQSKPNPRVTSYFLNSTYRKRLYEDWLFWFLRPQVVLPREDHWSAFWSISIGTEIIFKR